MTSEARVAANRRNAEKSTGPRTPEGKAIVAQNAVKHGLLARQAVMRDEDPQEFGLYRRQMLDELAPEGAVEVTLAERVVSLSWRLKRAERMQDEALDYLIEVDGGNDWVKHRRSGGDPSAGADLTFGRVAARDFAEKKTLDRLMMYERRIENSLYKTMNELHKLRLVRDEGSGDNAPCATLVSRVAPPNSLATSQVVEIGLTQATQTGGSGKAKGFADGEWANHRQAALAAATQNSTKWDASNSFDGADSMKPDQPKPHGQTSLPVPPGDCAKQSQSPAMEEPHGQQVAHPTSAEASMEVPMQGDNSLPCETKPMERVGSVCSVPARACLEPASEETPCGVTTNARQSQCRASATGVKAVLRPRPRVACHHHNVARSY